MIKLTFGDTTNAILLPGFFLGFPGTANLLENDFGWAFFVWVSVTL